MITALFTSSATVLSVSTNERLLTRKNDGNIYTVYFLASHDSNEIKYVGRVKTQNYNSRMAYHFHTRKLVPMKAVDGLTYEEARGLEEIGMLECHTLKTAFPYNIIHGISLNNPKRGLYMHDALGYLENKAEDILLNILEGDI